MKYAALITLAVFIAALAGAGYLFAVSQVSVTPMGVTVTEAADQPVLFESLRNQAAGGLVIGTPFDTAMTDDPAEYRFYTYTVRLRNGCRLTADMIELQVTPMTGDVLQIGDDSAKALPAGQTGDISATILTTAGNTAVREVTVSYYFWGLPFTAKLTCGR